MFIERIFNAFSSLVVKTSSVTINLWLLIDVISGFTSLVDSDADDLSFQLLFFNKGKRANVSPDGKRLSSPVDTRNIRGVTSCVAGFCGMGRGMGEGLGFGLPVNFQMV